MRGVARCVCVCARASDQLLSPSLQHYDVRHQGCGAGRAGPCPQHTRSASAAHGIPSLQQARFLPTALPELSEGSPAPRPHLASSSSAAPAASLRCFRHRPDGMAGHPGWGRFVGTWKAGSGTVAIHQGSVTMVYSDGSKVIHKNVELLRDELWDLASRRLT